MKETHETKGSKSRRRTCRDRFRYKSHENRRKGNPATSAALWLLALVLALFGRIPRVQTPVLRPSPAQEVFPDRGDVSRQQRERELGEGGHGFLPSHRETQSRRQSGRYRTNPTYRRLIADLRRPTPSARDEAAEILRRRLALETHEWLDDVLERRDGAALAWCARPGATDDETETVILKAALDWTEGRKPDGGGGGGSTPPPPGDDGPDGRKP
jgi:hypothetical protein